MLHGSAFQLCKFYLFRRHLQKSFVVFECVDVFTFSTFCFYKHVPFKMDRTSFYKWSQILAKLEEHFGAVAVSAWLDDAIVVEFTEDTLKIEVGSDFRCEVIKKRCLDHIQNALMELFGSKSNIEVYAFRNT